MSDNSRLKTFTGYCWATRFCVGDKFYLCDNKILCEYDYEERLLMASLEFPNKRASLQQQQVNIKFIDFEKMSN